MICQECGKVVRVDERHTYQDCLDWKKKVLIRKHIKEEILLTREDFTFIDNFSETMNLKEGIGLRIMLQVFLNKYKQLKGAKK